tara:strand:- start:138 stop:800 length:663 start_codon:yes stop_codon:yes gene_type:complete
VADLKKVFGPKPQDVKITPMALGTFVVRFDLPMSLVDDINKVYDESVKKLPDWNDELVGKIKEEKLINDILTNEMKSTFLNCFKTYLEITKKPFWTGYLHNAWINEMKAGEYNPMHYHSSDMTDLGLSSVLMLKRPSTYGKEAVNPDNPSNGWLEFIGGDQSPLSIPQLRVDAQVGEFYVFPYNLVHGVYPFSGTDEVRRTMSYNCNLFKSSQIEQEKSK